MNGDVHEQDCIVSDRGGIIENTHRIHVAVVDSSGKLLYSIGNPDRITLLRSAAKPAQALAIVETGALEKFGFDDADLALMCASHNSEQRHITRARSMLKRIHAKEDDLRCGGHQAISPIVDQERMRAGITPTGIHNNCSGKHAGMLAGAVAIGAGMHNYHHFDHPMQQRVKRVIEDLCHADDTAVQWSIDGCNLPAPAMPLRYIGQIFASLAAAADVPGTRIDISSERTQNLSRIFHAMSTYPELVAGDGRFCTALMQAFQGNLVGKVGADGCYGVAIRGSDETKAHGADGAIGIAIKVEDGDREILYSAVVEILEQLQIGNPETLRKLESFHHPPRLNTMGVVIGGYWHRYQIRARDC